MKKLILAVVLCFCFVSSGIMAGQRTEVVPEANVTKNIGHQFIVPKAKKYKHSGWFETPDKNKTSFAGYDISKPVIGDPPGTVYYIYRPYNNGSMRRY